MSAIQRVLEFLRSFGGGTSSRYSRSVVVAWGTAIALIATLVVGWIQTKAAIERQLGEYTQALVRLASDRAALTFDDIGRFVQTVGDGLRGADLDHASTRRATLQATLDLARAREPALRALIVTDPSGRQVAMSPPHRSDDTPRLTEPPPLSQEEMNSPAISAPFRDPGNGGWLIRMTHRISAPGGMTEGVLVADVSIDEALATFFQRFPLATGDVIALLDISDRQLAVFPPLPYALAKPANLIPDGVAQLEPGADDPTSGIRNSRLMVSRKISRYSFDVVYGYNMDAWQLRWRQEQFLILLVSLVALGTTAAITAGVQRRLALTRQLHQVRHALEESNKSLRATLSSAEMHATRDQLTGLCNRRNFDQRLEAAIARNTRHGDVFSLLMIDIDHFKSVNDYYGHATGDDVLRRFGEVLSDRVRQNDVAARWGGEEFVVLADGATLGNARMLGEQIRESIASTPFPPVPKLTVSIGLADYRQGESGDDLLRRAERALYGAKRNGRNRVIAAEASATLGHPAD